MALVETEQRYGGAFDELVCPVCGSENWTHLVFQGVFCTNCNTRCLLKEPAGDQGFIARFDGKYTWSVEGGEKIPETDEYGAVASGKWLGTPNTSYERHWFSTHAERIDDSYDGDWKPAWEREADNKATEDNGPNYLIELLSSSEETSAEPEPPTDSPTTMENTLVSGGDS